MLTILLRAHPYRTFDGHILAWELIEASGTSRPRYRVPLQSCIFREIRGSNTLTAGVSITNGQLPLSLDRR